MKMDLIVKITRVRREEMKEIKQETKRRKKRRERESERTKRKESIVSQDKETNHAFGRWKEETIAILTINIVEF